MQGHDSYLPYYSGDLKWTTDTQHYEDTFSYNKATDKMCRVGFNLGGSGVNVPFNVTVTNLKLIKIGGNNTETVEPTEPATEKKQTLCKKEYLLKHQYRWI